MHKNREMNIQQITGTTPQFYTSGFKLKQHKDSVKGIFYTLEASVYKCFGDYCTEFKEQPTAEQIKQFSNSAIEHAQLRDMI
jgi:hypothetical protein